MEQSNQKSNEDSEALRKEHEKMLEDDLNGIESKLTKQFLKDSAFIYNQINEGQSQKASLIPKKLRLKKSSRWAITKKIQNRPTNKKT